MSHIHAYPEFYSTNVNWLPRIPCRWKATRLKYAISALDSGVSVNATDLPAAPNELGVLKTSCVYTGAFRAEENKTVVSEELGRVKCRVKSGAIIISRMNTPELVGASGLVTEEHPNLFLPDRLWQTVFPRDNELVPKYLAYFLGTTGFRKQVSLAAEGASSSMQNVAKPDFLAIHALVPTLEEQTQIAKFLDYETAKIDALIEKQQQLIELLREKRQAVITHTVTKGLNPNAPMRDSGVEWLGKVPAHWIVRALKQSIQLGSSISYGIVQPGEPLENGVPFVQTTNISRGSFDLESLQRTTREIASAYPRSRLNGGEVILGIRASIGAAYVVPTHLMGCNLSRGIARILPSDDLEAEFLVWYLRSQVVTHYWGLSSQGSTFSEVSIDTVKKLLILVPPIVEQEKISSALRERTARLDVLVGKAEAKNDLLQERRTALISAAVTGKIDVRGWKPPVSEADAEVA